MMNILQIDVEDWYQGALLGNWESYEDRVVPSTRKVLAILESRKIRATFFILGYVAGKFPGLVEMVKSKGHEIASHGYGHMPITQQTPSEFEEDLSKSIRVLEKITGDRILGYRAPQFTLVRKTSWAIDIMKRNGLKYDSSIFPVRTHLYGVPDAPLFPYHISSSNISVDDPAEDFIEVPLSVYRTPLVGMNIPIAGGFYLRFFPFFLISHAIGKINKLKQPACVIFTPGS